MGPSACLDIIDFVIVNVYVVDVVGLSGSVVDLHIAIITGFDRGIDAMCLLVVVPVAVTSVTTSHAIACHEPKTLSMVARVSSYDSATISGAHVRP